MQELVLEGFTVKMSEYRVDRKRKIREDLEHLAEEEAELEQLALDLEAHSQYQKADVRLKTKLNLIEQEDYEEAKEYIDNLLQQRIKTLQEKKDKWNKRKKLAYKIIGVTAAVLSLGYGVSKISPVRAMHDENYSAQRELEERLKNAANVDCSGDVRMNEFLIIYKEATGKEFPNPHLVGSNSVYFKVDPTTNSINIKSDNDRWGILYYKITLPPKFAEQLILKKPTCSISLE